MKNFLITGSAFIVIALMTIFWAVGISNKEIDLKFKGEAQQNKCEAFFSNMWEILQTKASITDEYKDAFMEIYPKLIEGRYSKGDGTLMKWITESNPNFNTVLYEDLMASVEGQRNGFFVEQEKLIDIDREHKSLRAKFPASMVISNRSNIGATDGKDGIVILKNLATQDSYTTGTDKSPDLFGKNKN